MTSVRDYFRGLWGGRYDKTSHFTISAIITIVLRLFFSWHIVVYCLVVISVIKELYDLLVRRKKFDVLDIATNLLAMLIVLLIFYYFNLS